jgi:hypothetical protein
MKRWQIGDPVGMGEVYLPDKKTREAYQKACRDAWIDNAAQHAIRLSSLQSRRDFINSHPAKDELKARVTELWERKNARNG